MTEKTVKIVNAVIDGKEIRFNVYSNFIRVHKENEEPYSVRGEAMQLLQALFA